MMYCAMTAAEAPMMDTTKPRSNWAIVAFGPWRRRKHERKTERGEEERGEEETREEERAMGEDGGRT